MVVIGVVLGCLCEVIYSRKKAYFCRLNIRCNVGHLRSNKYPMALSEALDRLTTRVSIRSPAIARLNAASGQLAGTPLNHRYLSIAGSRGAKFLHQRKFLPECQCSNGNYFPRCISELGYNIR